MLSLGYWLGGVRLGRRRVTLAGKAPRWEEDWRARRH